MFLLCKQSSAYKDKIVFPARNDTHKHNDVEWKSDMETLPRKANLRLHGAYEWVYARVCVCARFRAHWNVTNALFFLHCVVFFSHLLCQPLNSLSQYLRCVTHKHDTTINSQKHAIIIGYMWVYACVFVHGYVLMLHELIYDPEIKGPPTTKILVEISVGYTIHRYLCAIIICKEGRNLLKNCDRRNMSKRQSLNQSLISTRFCYFFFNFLSLIHLL